MLVGQFVFSELVDSTSHILAWERTVMAHTVNLKPDTLTGYNGGGSFVRGPVRFDGPSLRQQGQWLMSMYK